MINDCCSDRHYNRDSDGVGQKLCDTGEGVLPLMISCVSYDDCVPVIAGDILNQSFFCKVFEN